MNILFITRLYTPHIGGVEKHLCEIAQSLRQKENSITILTERVVVLKNKEIKDGIRIVRFDYPHIKFVGLGFIWWKLLQNIKLIKEADVVHVHDVFIWYLPFRFLFPNKRIFTTFHGLEWDTPLSKISLWQKKLSAKMSLGTIGVGEFLERYTKIKFDLISYGASTLIRSNSTIKTKKSIVYVGRLEKNTGLLAFLKYLKENKYSRVDFCGDGPLRSQCEKFGKVHGFCDPVPFYKKAEYCVPGGYLAALEGLSYNCKLKLFWNNKLKEDYWKMSPFYKLKGKELKAWASEQTWDKLANEYLSLYRSSKST